MCFPAANGPGGDHFASVFRVLPLLLLGSCYLRVPFSSERPFLLPKGLSSLGSLLWRPLSAGVVVALVTPRMSSDQIGCFIVLVDAIDMMNVQFPAFNL
jgi:hypothetical protein